MRKTKAQLEAEDAQFYSHVQRILPFHVGLLSDAVRNKAFYEALKKHVTAESYVLDIGSGTGVWAITAAKLGAKKVVAVEKDKAMLSVINRLVKENGVERQVELVEGDSRQIKLKNKFDVIVSETIGNQAFDEQIASIMLDAKKRFLKPRGVLIPQRVALFAAAARLRDEDKDLPNGIFLSCDYLKSLLLQLPLKVQDRNRLEILSEPRLLQEIDLASLEEPPTHVNLTARWKLKKISSLNCFALWAESVLTEGISLSTTSAKSWQVLAFRFKPFAQKSGEVEFTFTFDKDFYWTISLTSHAEVKPQSYTPVFANLMLKAASRS